MKHPIMRYHGGKFRMAQWFMSFFPEHMTYVEPFGGAAGILLQKERSYSEVYNDLDRDVVTVFRVLQDPQSAKELYRKLKLTPYSREEFSIAYEYTEDPIESARRTLIRAHMGFGSAGASKSTTGFRIDSARKYGTAAHLWARYPKEVKFFTDRLQGVVIENKCALEVIDNHDREDTLFLIDPPYLMSTRQARKGGYYRHEMEDSDHEVLLDKVFQLEGFAILCGYDNEMYHDILKGWDCRSTTSRMSAGKGTGIRTEIVWLNPRCSANLQQLSIF